MKISLVLPVYNEEQNLKELFKETVLVLSGLKIDWEIIAVNDGSRDGSFNVLTGLAKNNERIKIINFKRNFGQTAAISAGIDNSSGDIIVLMDSDLENNPADIIKLLDKINEGYGVVSGWRKDRWKNKMITRKFPSTAANWIISKSTGIKLHDYGCTLKAYSREFIEDVKLYGEMHRFIPVYAAMYGAKIAEIPVNYRPRKHGKSNYNLSRVPKVILDLLTVLFLSNYFSKPMHFFGRLGFVLLFASFLTGATAVLLKLIKGISFILTPLPLLTVFLVIIGFQFILMGLLAEILIRVYYESNSKALSYLIKEKINFN